MIVVRCHTRCPTGERRRMTLGQIPVGRRPQLQSENVWWRKLIGGCAHEQAYALGVFMWRSRYGEGGNERAFVRKVRARGGHLQQDALLGGRLMYSHLRRFLLTGIHVHTGLQLQTQSVRLMSSLKKSPAAQCRCCPVPQYLSTKGGAHAGSVHERTRFLRFLMWEESIREWGNRKNLSWVS